jgi:hypothetical protein
VERLGKAMAAPEDAARAAAESKAPLRKRRRSINRSCDACRRSVPVRERKLVANAQKAAKFLFSSNSTKWPPKSLLDARASKPAFLQAQSGVFRPLGV